MSKKLFFFATALICIALPNTQYLKAQTNTATGVDALLNITTGTWYGAVRTGCGSRSAGSSAAAGLLGR